MRHPFFRTLVLSAIVVATSFALLLPTAGLGAGEELFNAIRDGNTAFIKTHLSKSDLAVRDKRGATPLMHAAAFGNFETLKLLVDAGADANAHNDHDATALLWAARDTEKARLLIERGADVNATSMEGQTPLIAAATRPDFASMSRARIAASNVAG